MRKIFYQWIVLGLILIPFTAQADDLLTKTDLRIAGMQAQIDALNKRVDQLEQRLQQITQRNLSSPAALPAQPELTALEEVEKLRISWGKLRRGLSKTELQQLLGEPVSTLKLDRQILWYYKYPAIGSGSVMFDYSGKVSAWQKPPFP